jgi:hypothetical protein
MDEMNITSAQYNNSENTSIVAVINGITMYVPTEAGNTEYDEIMRQVAAGTLTIQDAD